MSNANLVFGVDVVLLSKKMISKNRNKYKNVEDIVQDAIGDASVSFDPSRGVKFDNFCWKIFNNKIKDKLDYDNVRKNNVSLSHGEFEIPNRCVDIVKKVYDYSKELYENGTINQQEFDIIVMKSHRYENQEIANKLGLTPGRISQIWAELKDLFGQDME